MQISEQPQRPPLPDEVILGLQPPVLGFPSHTAQWFPALPAARPRDEDTHHADTWSSTTPWADICMVWDEGGGTKGLELHLGPFSINHLLKAEGL